MTTYWTTEGKTYVTGPITSGATTYIYPALTSVTADHAAVITHHTWQTLPNINWTPPEYRWNYATWPLDDASLSPEPEPDDGWWVFRDPKQE